MSCPIALRVSSLVECLAYLISLHQPCDVIICLSRNDFVKLCLQQQEDIDSLSVEQLHRSSRSIFSDLIRPTLSTLATSKDIQISFIPSPLHLKAHMSMYRRQAFEIPSHHSNSQALHIVGIADMHRRSDIMTAQDLNQSYAAVVAAVENSDTALTLIELDQSAPTASNEDSEADHATLQWDEVVPLFSGSIRSRGDERTWMGRTTTLRSIIEQWAIIQR